MRPHYLPPYNHGPPTLPLVVTRRQPTTTYNDDSDDDDDDIPLYFTLSYEESHVHHVHHYLPPPFYARYVDWGVSGDHRHIHWPSTPIWTLPITTYLSDHHHHSMTNHWTSVEDDAIRPIANDDNVSAWGKFFLKIVLYCIKLSTDSDWRYLPPTSPTMDQAMKKDGSGSLPCQWDGECEQKGQETLTTSLGHR